MARMKKEGEERREGWGGLGRIWVGLSEAAPRGLEPTVTMSLCCLSQCPIVCVPAWGKPCGVCL